MGLLNARSACHKAALIHDVIADNQLDILLLTETWIPSEAPDAVKLDVAPSGYSVVHRHRPGTRAGGSLVGLERANRSRCTNGLTLTIIIVIS